MKPVWIKGLGKGITIAITITQNWYPYHCRSFLHLCFSQVILLVLLLK
jgi:hypothetical protein